MRSRPSRRARSHRLTALVAAVVLSVSAHGARDSVAPARAVQAVAQAEAAPARLPIAVCFAPGTPDSYRESVECAIAEGPAIAQYQAADGARWSTTATNGTGLSQGDKTTLTWGIVPDGTMIDSFSGEGSAPSNLRAFLTGIYGSESAWMALFEKIFERWSEVSGIKYVYEPADDAVPLGFRAGIRGTRADVRIGGHRIDGNGGTLAYNFFPNASDMVIDTADRYYNVTSSNSLRLRNTVAHESGHGLGFGHVCPVNGTKLMEPVTGSAFDGPQLDDILAAQRLYGDTHEPNDSVGGATPLGAADAETRTVRLVSIDDGDDQDYYSFEAPAGTRADIVLTPVGSSYADGAQSNSGCGPSQVFNALTRVDLRMSLLGTDGSTVLASSDTTPAGGAESLFDVGLLQGAGTYTVRVRGDGSNRVQLYTLEIALTAEASVITPVADFRVLPEDSSLTIDVLANDAGATDRLVTVKVTTAPLHGRASVLEDGTVNYRPARDFVGEDAFTYTVFDDVGQSAAADVTVSVEPSPRAGFAKIDSDADVYPDDLEIALGTELDDGGSRPASGGTGTLVPGSARIALNFAKSSRDKAALRALVAVPEGFDPAGRTLSVYLGGVVRTFTLDAKGKGADGSSKVRLVVKKSKGIVPAQDARLELVLRKQDLAASLADEDLTPDAQPRRDYREATVFVLIDDSAVEATLPLAYAIKRNRRRARAVLLRR